MLRSSVPTFVAALFVAGCTIAPLPQASSPPGSSGAQEVPNAEVHRGLLQNQRSSPDAPSGDGRGQ